MPHRVKTEIFGDEYVIVGDADPEYIQEISSQVDSRMRELAKQNKNFSKTKLAILTAVNLADEMNQVKQNPGSIDQMELAAKRLISMLDEGITGDY